MSKRLESFRKFAGHTITALGLKELFRALYSGYARRYVFALRNTVKGAWMRRSSVTADFVPFMSDIDLTILISEKNLEELYRKKAFSGDILVKDIQLLSERFLPSWEMTGGIRGRQCLSWKSISGASPKLTPPALNLDHILAFELGQEAYLIYHQLEQRLSTKKLDVYGVKLALELERLFAYWESRDEKLLLLPRKSFLRDDIENPKILLQRLEEFSLKLIQNLHEPMGSFEIDPLIRVKTGSGSWLYLKIRDKDAFLLPDFSIPALPGRSEIFFVTPNFLKLMKGIGTQEQLLLNEASKKLAYYIHFNVQRLAHDLIGAILLDPENQEQIYFCFKNNNEFLATHGLSSKGWEKLRGQTSPKIPWEENELLETVRTDLDLLASVLNLGN